MKTLIATLVITTFGLTGLMVSDSADASSYTYSSKPNFNGGYDYYDYNGRIGSSKPNFNGGYDYKYGW